MSRLQVAALVVLAWTLFVCVVQSEGIACESGWFGSKCRYKCRCKDNLCDKEGKCTGGSKCLGGWFGPACQYSDIAYRQGELENLTDGDDGTCIDETDLKSTNINLMAHYKITWIRFYLNQSGNFHEIKFRMQSGTTFFKCLDIALSTPDSRTLDVDCETDKLANSLLIGGSSIPFLCSVYISGGRNVALKMYTEQSGEFYEMSQKTDFENISFPADLAVDGDRNGDFYGGKTCAYTGKAYPTFWHLQLSTPMIVNRYEIYNIEDPRESRLVGFQLTSYGPYGRIVYSYTDQLTYSLLKYILQHDDMLVEKVTVQTPKENKGLLVCEVEVYGDYDCDYGYFGLECDKKCNCHSQEACFVRTGGCPSHCTTGYHGADCSTPCAPGTYGADCKQLCSNFCTNDSRDNRTCEHEMGDCLRGCEPGYKPPKCDTVCHAGRYGRDCSLSCSPACNKPAQKEMAYCNRINGECVFGCTDGYLGTSCSTSCLPNTYGRGCRFSCSRGCVSSNISTISSCHFITGVCEYGCVKGYNGSLCKTRMLPRFTKSQTSQHLHLFVTLATVASVLSAFLIIVSALFLVKKKMNVYKEESLELQTASESTISTSSKKSSPHSSSSQITSTV